MHVIGRREQPHKLYVFLFSINSQVKYLFMADATAVPHYEKWNKLIN